MIKIADRCLSFLNVLNEILTWVVTWHSKMWPKQDLLIEWYFTKDLEQVRCLDGRPPGNSIDSALISWSLSFHYRKLGSKLIKLLLWGFELEILLAVNVCDCLGSGGFWCPYFYLFYFITHPPPKQTNSVLTAEWRALRVICNFKHVYKQDKTIIWGNRVKPVTYL